MKRWMAVMAGVTAFLIPYGGAFAAPAKMSKAQLERAAQSARMDLSSLGLGDGKDARPSVLGPVQNSVRQEGGRYIFSCKGQDETIEYRLSPKAGLLERMEVRVNGRPLSVRPFNANPMILTGGDKPAAKAHKHRAEDELVLVDGLPAEQTPAKPVIRSQLKGRLMNAVLTGDVLKCRYAYEESGLAQPIILDVRFHAAGKTLDVGLSSDSPSLVGFQIDTPVGEPVPVEYAAGSRDGVRYLASDHVYAGAFPDPWLSDASGVGRDRVVYNPLTDGRRHHLRDTFHLTVTSHYGETLSSTPFPPSPYMKEFAHRVYLDLWEGSFQDSADWLKELYQYGVNSCIVLKHSWMRKGFDRSWPKGYPANKGLGGDEGLRRLSLLAQKLGHRFGIHENLYDISPGTAGDLWRPEDMSLKSDGSLLGHIGGRFYLLKPSRHEQYAAVYTGEAIKRYALDATFDDVMPRSHVDYDASVPGAGMYRSTLEDQVAYFKFIRDLSHGPALTEMISGTLAGAWDGAVNAYKNNMLNRKPLVAFELLKVHPKMVNQGVGYYERWLPQGASPGWNYYNMTDRQMDRYRALTVAFGRMGVILRQINNLENVHAAVREYYLMQAFGRAYTGQRLVHLAYAVGEGDQQQWIDAATAARLGQWQRLRAIYEDGQAVYVNYADKPWEIAGHRLPGWGSMTIGPRATAMTAFVDKQIADYAHYGDVTYADARSNVFHSPGVTKSIEPSLGAWKDNGNGTFDLSVNWHMGRKLNHDFYSFWEFKDADARSSRPVFGGAHAITASAPTSKWKVGQTYTDGPHTLTIPKGTHGKVMEVIVGMTHPEGYASRPRLVDIYDKVRIAQLHVTYKDGKVASLRFEAAPMMRVYDTSDKAYRKDSNVDHRTLDFGDVATNGAVVVRQTDEGRQIIPVPMGETMTVGLTGDVSQATAYDVKGKRIGTLDVSSKQGKQWFTIPAEAGRVVVK